jgi:hypothetical protein
MEGARVEIMNMIRTTVFLTSQQVAGLLKLAKGTGARPAESIRRALDAYLKRKNRKMKLIS